MVFASLWMMEELNVIQGLSCKAEDWKMVKQTQKKQQL